MKTKLVALAVVISILSACGGDSEPITGFYSAQPYSNNAPANLQCVLRIYQGAIPCTLEELSIIGMETTNPTRDDIMNRLMVSDQWMGDRFMAVLDQLPPDVLLLLRSVTAIVISGDIRPSFYTTQTGAIYIDPENLWLTNAERDDISQAQDFRSDFANSLNFVGLWRYLNEDGTWNYAPSSFRTVDDLVAPVASTIYHELAHANTFLPPSVHASINPANTLEEAIIAAEASNISIVLEDTLPLQSAELKGLALVMYFGDSPNATQQAFTPSEVGAFLESDRANDDYAYIDYGGGVFHEDAAMLFEELMMKYHFNIDREIAYTNTASSYYCNDYIIQWGQKGRIGDSNVKEAARLVSALLLPEADLNTFIDNLALPIASPVRNWCEPLEIAATLAPLSSTLGSSMGSTNSIFEVDISSNKLPSHFR